MRDLATNRNWLHPRLALCYLSLVVVMRCEAQNLVPNPSFELLTDTCPCNIGFQGTAKPLYWEKWNQSPEYFHACVESTCMADTLIDVPQNGFGFQYAQDGDAYVGMGAYDGNGDFREYVGCQLLAPLQVGVTYNVSLYANVAVDGNYWLYNSTIACNNLGMLFTMQPNIWTDVDQPPFALRNYAHLHSTAIISDSANWTLVSGTFQADSAYQYLVIGNFFSDALTDTSHIGSGLFYVSYYYVDGVCVTTNAESCPFLTGVEELQAGVIGVFPNPAIDNLEVSCGMAGMARVEVFDAGGRLVWSTTTQGEQVTLDVRDWPVGQYQIRVQGQEVKHARFVVTH